MMINIYAHLRGEMRDGWTGPVTRKEDRAGRAGKSSYTKKSNLLRLRKTPPPCSSVRTKGRGSGDDDVLRGQSIGPRRSEGEE